jgi:hypothetical protein
MPSSKAWKETKTEAVRCRRCGGRMILEKFFDVNNTFQGWHCLICGEILDPVILLHRLSQDADLAIPKEENEVLNLVKKYLLKKTKGTGTKPTDKDVRLN